MGTADLAGRTVLVTGGTGGIGRATATALAARGARVGIIGRDPDRTRGIAGDIAAEAGGGSVDGFGADLSSQAEVRRVAAQVVTAYDRLDVLVNNAGGSWHHRHTTADGLERTFALNHLAPFLLTHLLLDRLQAAGSARIVTVASEAQRMGRLDFDDLQGERRYSGNRAYCQSKLANVMFTYALARRLDGSGITANVLHPGVVRTGFGAEDQPPAARLLLPLVRPFLRSPQRGARTSVYLAASPEVAGVSGQYFSDCRPRRSSARSYDDRAQERLWEVSAALVGIDDRS